LRPVAFRRQLTLGLAFSLDEKDFRIRRPFWSRRPSYPNVVANVASFHGHLLVKRVLRRKLCERNAVTSWAKWRGREVAPYPYGKNIVYMGRRAIHRYKYLI